MEINSNQSGWVELPAKSKQKFARSSSVNDFDIKLFCFLRRKHDEVVQRAACVID